MTPRFLIAGTGSGCGKTTVTCAVLKAFQSLGWRVMAGKSGCDYIDPMFHSRVIGVESGNLDLFFMGDALARYQLQEHSRGFDLTVLEGAMGYYDGIAMGSDASAWALSVATETPTVLVVDARGTGVSICAVIQGFVNYRKQSNIKGVILNQCSAMLYPRLKQVIEQSCSVSVYGYLPKCPECVLESRHLGLKTAGEIADLQQKMTLLAQQARKSLDLQGLLTLAHSATALQELPPTLPDMVQGAPTVAIAKDAAFCFYYRDNLELLQQLGGKIVYFSPLAGDSLPACDAVHLGGGYPELYADRLSQNSVLRQQLKERIAQGLPTIAECGGFLYLQGALENEAGEAFPMCGVFEGTGANGGRLKRFGYITLTAKKDFLLCRAGEQIPAHEFHYWDCPSTGTDFTAQKPQSVRGWECAHATPTLYAGFPHLYFYAAPQMVKRFLLAAVAYREKRE